MIFLTAQLYTSTLPLLLQCRRKSLTSRSTWRSKCITWKLRSLGFGASTYNLVLIFKECVVENLGIHLYIMGHDWCPQHHPTKIGTWSIMATIRWCPIYPKWDSYQPLYIFSPSIKSDRQWNWMELKHSNKKNDRPYPSVARNSISIQGGTAFFGFTLKISRIFYQPSSTGPNCWAIGVVEAVGSQVTTVGQPSSTSWGRPYGPRRAWQIGRDEW